MLLPALIAPVNVLAPVTERVPSVVIFELIVVAASATAKTSITDKITDKVTAKGPLLF